MTSELEAKQLVNDICTDHAYIREEDWNYVSEERREMFRRAMLASHTMIGQSIKVLAENLYTSKARFVFELLQNADDNDYSRAEAVGADPYVSFQLHSNRIVMECNEDGFSGENLKAICSIGKSSKSHEQDYIGEKGIGFKSVFMAAKRVHIQSGYFSFCFNHKKGDTGIGMVTPIWQETNGPLPIPLTRITLYLHDEADPISPSATPDPIIQQFHDIQQTCLLFLRKLKEIRISYYDKNEILSSTTSFQLRKRSGDRAVIASLTTKDGVTRETSEIYHLTRYEVSDLSKHENRKYSQEQESQKSWSRAEVVLAFPSTSEMIPIIKPQDLFVSLPVKQSNFKFLIHSDFNTVANREEIVTTSKRNAELLKGVANAFILAVEQFCKQEMLCTSWPKYLPQLTDGLDHFWARLIPEIQAGLQTKKILRSRSDKGFHEIGEVTRPPSHALDKQGNPLFDDNESDIFISGRYDAAELSSLVLYGLRPTSPSHLVHLVNQDLSNTRSKLKLSTDQDWLSRVAKLLLHTSSTCSSTLKKLAILPLRDSEWTSPEKTPNIYLPTANGLAIPEGPKLKVLDPIRTENTDQLKLFKYLGAKEASIQQVRDAILDWNRLDVLHKDTSKTQLSFLYLSDHLRKHDEKAPSKICLLDESWRPYLPHEEDLYVRDEHPYGPNQLFGPAINNLFGSPYASGHREVRFLDQRYLENPPVQFDTERPSWKEWLHRFLGIRRYIRLVSRDGNKLSRGFVVLSKRYPKKFLLTLRYLWQNENQSRECPQALVEQIKSISVSCRGGKYCRLNRTYLPTQELQRQTRRFLKEPEDFQFLDITGGESTEDPLTEWNFLHDSFGVSKDYNLSFLLDILKHVTEEGIPVEKQRILGLYRSIHGLCVAAEHQAGAIEYVRETFQNMKGIYCPLEDDNDHSKNLWAAPTECLWDAPIQMETMNPLKALYKTYFKCSDSDMQMISDFFRRTLSVRMMNHDDAIKEIKKLKNISAELFSNTGLEATACLYEFLSQITSQTIQHQLRTLFREDRLIYIVSGSCRMWHKSSECIWSGQANIRGKVPLKGYYPDLETFFVEILSIERLTPQLIHDELLERGTTNSSVSDVKSLLWMYNDILRTGTQPPSPEKLLETRILPVLFLDGSKRLVSAETDFAIVDRQALANHFTGCIRVLDYSLEEVHRLQPFLEWAGIRDRYLSALVKEESRVSGGVQIPITLAKRDVGLKAHAIIRIAAHFNSPRYLKNKAGLYRLLRTLKVIETDGISSVQRLVQDGTSIELEVNNTDLHLTQEESQLYLYVPREEIAQEVCFGTKLPRILAEWLMRESADDSINRVNDSVSLILASILTYGLPAVDRALEEQGIGEIDLDFSDETEDAELSIDSRVPETTATNTVFEGGRESSGDTATTSNENIPVTSQDSPIWITDSSSSTSGVEDQEAEDVQAHSREESEDIDSDEADESSIAEGSQEDDETPPTSNQGQDEGLSSFLSSTRSTFTRSGGNTTTSTNSSSLFGSAMTSGFVFTAGSDRHATTSTISSYTTASAREASSNLLGPRPHVLNRPVFSQHSISVPNLGNQDQMPDDDVQYRELLTNVVTAARRSRFPIHGVFDLSGIRDGLPDLEEPNINISDRGNPFRPPRQFEQDCKIGAAGELYVFELLSRLEPILPDWGQANWQSTMRRFASLHQDYVDMPPWRGRETADFTYDDTQGIFTAMLIDNGYLDRQNWANARPRYYIEAKATIKGCSQPFFLSKSQFKLMRDIHSANQREAWNSRKEIYMVLRVYNIKSSSPGMRVYVDPEEHRLGGRLEFTAETYTVRPGAA